MIDPQPVFAETGRLYRRSPRGSRGAVWERRGIEFVMEDVARRKAMRSVLVAHPFADGREERSALRQFLLSTRKISTLVAKDQPNTVRAKKYAPRDS